MTGTRPALDTDRRRYARPSGSDEKRDMIIVVIFDSTPNGIL